MSTKTTFVLGASGTQGGAVLAELIRRGEKVRAGVASSASATRLQGSGIEAVVVDLTQIESLVRAFEGTQRLSIVLPVSAGLASAEILANILSAAEKAGIEFAVFEPRATSPVQVTEVGFLELNRALVNQFLDGPVRGAVVEATVYLENFLGPWAKPAIVNDGVLAYPFPENYRAGWVSAGDTAKVIAALLDRESDGVRVRVFSDEDLTTEEVAAAIGDALGKQVRFQPIPPDAFAKGLAESMGLDVAEEIGKLYQWHADQPKPARAVHDPLIAELGVELESVLDWARRQDWR